LKREELLKIIKKLLKDPDMLEEYDFSKGIRGKYAQRYAEGTNVVVIEPVVVKEKNLRNLFSKSV